MAIIKPFRAMTYTAGSESYPELCCPPYDIIPQAERERLYSTCEHNAIHLELPEGEGALRYANAAATLKKWLAEGALGIRDKAGFYLCQHEFELAGGRHIFRGLIARAQLEDFANGVILPHEETLTGAKQDRYDLMLATGCNFSEVMTLYKDEGEIDAILSKTAAGAPDIDFKSADGLRHCLWAIEDEADCAALSRCFEPKTLLIADGHHRYETALRYRDHLIESQGSAGNADCVMMMLVDMDRGGLFVLPTHRMVVGDPVLPEEVISKVADNFAITEISRAEALIDPTDTMPAFTMAARGRYFRFVLKDSAVMRLACPGRSEAYCNLDVAVLHDLVLLPVFGIIQSVLACGSHVKYTRDAEEAMDAYCSAAFILRSPKIQQINDVAADGDKMPQKSTYFYPKTLTGMVFNNFKY